jgi:hypothetical protein
MLLLQPGNREERGNSRFPKAHSTDSLFVRGSE